MKRLRDAKDGRKKADPDMVMVPKLMHLEKALWAALDELAKENKKTRSSYIRSIIKGKLKGKLLKVGKIDWEEFDSNTRLKNTIYD